MSDESPDLFAWIGRDEFGSGEVGLKRGRVPAGDIPLVATRREKMDRPALLAQLQAQADDYNVEIRLVRYTGVETVVTITPRPRG